MTASTAVTPTDEWNAQQARERHDAMHAILAERAALRQQLVDTNLRLEAALSMLTPDQRAQLPAL